MKKFLSVIVVVLLVVAAMSFVSCAKKSSTTPTSPAPTQNSSWIAGASNESAAGWAGKGSADGSATLSWVGTQAGASNDLGVAELSGVLFTTTNGTSQLQTQFNWNNAAYGYGTGGAASGYFGQIDFSNLTVTAQVYVPASLIGATITVFAQEVTVTAGTYPRPAGSDNWIWHNGASVNVTAAGWYTAYYYGQSDATPAKLVNQWGVQVKDAANVPSATIYYDAVTYSAN
jgi:hypothetical protein